MRSSVEPRAADDEDRGGRGLVVASDGPDHGPTVQFGEHQVQHDQGRPMSLDRVQGGRSVRRGHDAEAVALQVRAHQPDDLRIVIDDQDRPLRDDIECLVRHGQHGRGAMLGRSRDGGVTAAELTGRRIDH